MSVYTKSICKSIAVISAIILSFYINSSFAQLPLAPSITEPSEIPSTELKKDALGRETPKGLLSGFLSAVKQDNYERASRFIDLDKYPEEKRLKVGAQLSKSLQTLLDQGGAVVSLSQLSNNPNGKQNDGLDIDFDIIGNITIGNKKIDVLAEKFEHKEYGPIWRISKTTVLAIPLSVEDEALGYLDTILPKYLIENKISGVPVGHWAAIVSIALTALMISWFLTSGVILFINLIWKSTTKGYGQHLLNVFVWPIRIYIAVIIFAIAANMAGISVIARQNFGAIVSILAWLSVVWFFWCIIDIVTDVTKKRLIKEKRRSALSAVMFFRRGARLTFIFIVGAIIFHNIGWDITAGLTALGIGGLAIAFGAQKTLENLMASLTIILEQPMRVDDFCRIGDALGTVIEIGMRSTRIQTLDKTIITIPNGQLATMNIENYALRDRFLFKHDIGVRYETTPDQIRYILVKIRELMYSHPCVDLDPSRVRFNRFDAYSLNIAIFSYIFADDYNDFLEIQEDLMLRIMDIVNGAGSSFAFPSQTLYLGKDAPLSKEKREAAEKEVYKWKERNKEKLHHFDEDEIKEIFGTLEYLPKAKRNHRTNKKTK